MKPIKFIDNFSFSWENFLGSSGSSGRASEIFMRQGDFDSDCAIYSLMMMLIIKRRINRRDVVSPCKFPELIMDKSFRDEFLGTFRSLPGPYKGGYFLNDLNDKLQSFRKDSAVQTFSTDPEREDYINKSDLHNKIREALESEQPVQIGYTFKNNKFGRSVVAIGYQDSIDETRMLRLFCLDPGHELFPLAFWNNIIDINFDINPEITHQDWSHADNKYLNICNVDEILTIDE